MPKKKFPPRWVAEAAMRGIVIRGNHEPIFKAEFIIDAFNLPPLDFEQTTKPVALIGPAGIGKTQFALAHFTRPLVCRSPSQLRAIEQGDYDGIILEVEQRSAFRKWDAHAWRHALGPQRRHAFLPWKNANWSPEIPLIMCANTLPKACQEDPGVGWRLRVMHFTDPLFSKEHVGHEEKKE